MKKIIILFSSILFCHFASADEYLLKPTGEYQVGFQDYHWIDKARCPDIFYNKSKNEQDFSQENRKNFCTEFMVRIYYPTEQAFTKENRALYYQPVMKYIENSVQALKFPNLSKEKIDTLSQLKSFTIENAPLVKGKIFPVLFFEPGAFAQVQNYENTIGNLVSHGYIVVGINNTFLAAAVQFPDGHTVMMDNLHHLNHVPTELQADNSIIDNII